MWHLNLLSKTRVKIGFCDLWRDVHCNKSATCINRVQPEDLHILIKVDDKALRCFIFQPESIHSVSISPKILYTKVSDKMAHANSVDPDQTAPEWSSLIRVYTVCHSTKYFRKQHNKKQNIGQKIMEQSFPNFRTFTTHAVCHKVFFSYLVGGTGSFAQDTDCLC